MQQAAFTKAKIDRSAVMVAYADSFEAIATSQNSGGSGGLGPCTITMINNQATY
jgi:hypothetical protein